MGVENLKDALHGPLGFLDLREHPGCRSERSDQNACKQHEGKQIAGGHRSVDDLPSSVPQHRGGGGKGHEGDRRHKPGHDGRAAQGQRHRRLDLGDESLFFAFGLNERFHDADSCDDFFHQRADGGGLVLNRRREGPEPPSEQFCHDDQQRQEHQDEQAELPVHRKQEARAADERDDLFGRIDRCIGHDVLNDGDIVHEPGHQLAGPALGEKVDGEGLKMGEEVCPEVRHDPLRDPGRQVAVSHRAEPLQQDQSQEQQDHLRHAFGIVLNGDHIPERPSQAEQGQIHGCNRHDHNGGGDHPGNVGLEEGVESVKREHGCYDNRFRGGRPVAYHRRWR